MATDLVDEKGELDTAAAEAIIDKELAKAAPPEEPKESGKPKEKPVPEEEKAEDEAREKKPDGSDDREEKDARRPVSPWMDSQDIRDIAESLGMKMEELVDFESEGEFQRAIRLLDKQLAQEGRKLREAPSDAKSAEKPAEKVDAEEAPKEAERPRDKQGRFIPAEQVPYKVSLDPEIYDDGIIKEFAAVQEHFQKRVAALEAELREHRMTREAEYHRGIVHRFDSIVDGLGHDDLFGKSGELSDEQRKARGELWDEVADILGGAVQRGKRIDLDKGTLLRACNSRFADQLQAKTRRSVYSKLQARSKQRMGGGDAVSKTPKAGPPYSDLIDAYRDMERENGGR